MSKRIISAVVSGAFLAAATPSLAAESISGAGATFPYPVYAKWAQAYNERTGVQMNYQSIGSGGGIKQIKAKTVTFGASDKPLTVEELDAAGLMQWPQIMGGVVVIVNLPGVTPGQLKLDSGTLVKVFMGEITKWNDPAIAALNPGVKLPGLLITVVHRSDGSGTTFNFTDYLSKVSSDWKDKVGANSAVAWPTGVAGKGNEGVAAYVGQIIGSVGYVEYAYALENKMSYTQLKNADGNFVSPSAESFQAAAAGADWKNAPGFRLILTDQPGAKSWPITAASFILMYKNQDDPKAGLAALKFFDWSFENGDRMADELAYVAIPDSVVDMIQARWRAEIKDAKGKALWK